MKEKENILLVILFYILLRNLSFKFYHSTEGHAFLFWPCFISYVLLIIDKLPVEFSLLMPLLHLPLETTNRFIHPRHFLTILLSLYFFLSWILDSLLVSLCFVFSYYLKLLWILLKRIYFISFHFICSLLICDHIFQSILKLFTFSW